MLGVTEIARGLEQIVQSKDVNGDYYTFVHTQGDDQTYNYKIQKCDDIIYFSEVFTESFGPVNWRQGSSGYTHNFILKKCKRGYKLQIGSDSESKVSPKVIEEYRHALNLSYSHLRQHLPKEN